MTMLDHIPTLTDEALSTLLGNAQRLEQSGTPAQRTAASELLPAIREELSQRVASKRAAARTARPAQARSAQAKPARKKPARKAAEEEGAGQQEAGQQEAGR